MTETSNTVPAWMRGVEPGDSIQNTPVQALPPIPRPYCTEEIDTSACKDHGITHRAPFLTRGTDDQYNESLGRQTRDYYHATDRELY
ncbi:MAG TPA: hypothetical protein VEA92_01325 [Candidatus Paceibacterota bacterium]|nr:hypothetical protein [Candidatus Paceibacterota bacterium]